MFLTVENALALYGATLAEKQATPGTKETAFDLTQLAQ
jgi:hypothetical protein